MTQEIREQLSAFVDDELSEAEAELLIRRLGADPALRSEAGRMLQLSQSVRGERSLADAGFAARIFAAIHDEPELPQAQAQPAIDNDSRFGWGRMVAGGGIVAAVAVLAITALPGGDQLTAPDAALPVAADATPQNEELPYEYVVPATLQDSGLVSADPELAAYFLSHSVSGPSLAPGAGRARMLSATPPDGEDDAASEDTAQ